MKKIIAGEQSSPHLRKIGHMFPCILYFFHSPQPNNIGPAWQQPRARGSLFYFSESDRGEGHSYYLLAMRLDYMGFAMEATTEWSGGRGHTLQPHSHGTGDKRPYPPKISEFCLGLGGGGGTKVFYPP